MARYPWSKRCVHDNEGVFVGWEQQSLDKCNVKDVPTASRNPQANSMCEQMHQSVGNILRTLLHGDPPENVSKANDMVDEVSLPDKKPAAKLVNLCGLHIYQRMLYSHQVLMKLP